MNILLVTPPLTQINTPYPATTQLKAYLDQRGHTTHQVDLGIEVIDRILTPDFLKHVGLEKSAKCIERVVRFLRGQDDTIAPRIANRSLLPEGRRFKQLCDMEWAFGTSGIQDKARYLATLFIEDIADHIRTHTDKHFDLVRYAEYLSNYAPTFDELHNELCQPASVVDQLMLDILNNHIEQYSPDLIGFTIPFPGCLYAALRCGQSIKQMKQAPAIVMGGGFPNTEWRQLNEPRLFDYTDYVILDDGEKALDRLAERIAGNASQDQLIRTYWRDTDGTIRYSGNEHENEPFSALPAPTFEGLDLDKYLSTAEMSNPMHRLWSCGKWNKMMVAHGCYWHRCAFCDTSLDYIARFDSPTASTVVDRIEHIIRQTGISGFHFVDEALPPKLLKEICEEILRRDLSISFWGNIRFEKAYTQELCDLMSDAGCIAVSGGLEVASDRLLGLIDKGVTVEQATQACRHFRNSGIMVHSYLMYGFPTETLQETIDALDTVRKMFDEGIVQSAFWHRYAMTCHSPSGQNAEHYGTRRTRSKSHPFCNNEVDFVPTFDYDIETVGRGLAFATYNYMNGIGTDMPLDRWFDIPIPPRKKKQTRRQH